MLKENWATCAKIYPFLAMIMEKIDVSKHLMIFFSLIDIDMNLIECERAKEIGDEY